MFTASSPAQDPPPREFALRQRDFLTISRVVRESTGIVLGDRKRDLVYSRLARRLRALGCKTFSDYCSYLDSPDGEAERRKMLNAITTNLTAFFREAHHFAYLADVVLANLRKTRERSGRRLRIWSAGCSSGEEPYSIAMTVRTALGDDARWDAKILATDIDTEMVASGEAGRYLANRAASIPSAMRHRFVRRVDDHTIEMADELRSMVFFRELNLFDHWPMRGPFDAIFCRNVVIYFDNDAKRVLFDRLADILTPSGWLFVGHSESLFRVTDRFRQVGRTIHQRMS